MFDDGEVALDTDALPLVDGAVRSAAARVARDAIRQAKWDEAAFETMLAVSLLATSVGLTAYWHLPWWAAIVAALVQLVVALGSAALVPDGVQPWASWLAFACGGAAGTVIVALQGPSPA